MITVNKIIKALAIILIFLMIIPIQKNFAQTNSFYVYFKQNGKRVNIVKNKVELKKQSFKMFVEYTEPLDLLVNTSQKSKTYLKAQKGKLMFNIPSFSKLEKLESFFSKKNELCFSEENSLIWKKNETDEKEVIKTEKNRFVISKNIKYFFDKKEKVMVQLKDIKKKAYFVFIYAEKDKEGDYQEIQREFVKIKWVESYDEDTKNFARNKKRVSKLKIKQAERNLKQKQRLEKQEKERLDKIEEHKVKKAAKAKEKAEKKLEKEKKKSEKK